MANTFETSGFYGSGNTPCTIYVYENRSGSRWYVVEGGAVVNKTWNEIPAGTNVEELEDIDCFTWSGPINSLEELEAAVES